ncbi:MAG: hypothetical protein K2G45_06195 [Lachnospiraceae bacterium]|nr:hypothetical protein [Lachnospiraceae bacterium]
MSVVRDIIAKADSTPGMTAEIKETLNLLYELSKQKADSFENQIMTSLRTAGTVENQTVPTKFKIGSHQEIRVTTQNTPNGDIIKGIGGALKTILTGTKDNVIDGLTDLINSSLTVILGAEEGKERMEHSYYIATDGMSIVRLDLMCWSRHISAAGIKKYAEKSLVCTAVKSSVDLEKLDFNTFLSAYNAQLVRCKFKDEQLLEELQNARKIYDYLCGKTMDKAVRASIGMDSANRIENSIKLDKIKPDKNFKNSIQSVQTQAKGAWPK